MNAKILSRALLLSTLLTAVSSSFNSNQLSKGPSLTTFRNQLFSKQSFRELQGGNESTTCSICQGSTLLQDAMPLYTNDELPPNMTCGHFEDVATQIPIEECSSSGVRSLYNQCCKGRIPRYQCESNIRQTIREDYDPAVPPILDEFTPLDVDVHVTYQTVVDIDVQAGTAKIFLSFTLAWNDPRFVWEMNEGKCADHVTMWASLDPQKTEIWVPEIDLLNQLEGVQNLPDTMAMVYMDGTIVWNRNGGVTAICLFQGLAQIPFDTLECQLLFGPWTRTDPKYIHYRLYEGSGLEFGSFTAQYNEFLPVPELAESGESPVGSILYFNFFFRRAQHYYVFNIVIPTIILTYVSFGTFLLDLRVGERLSYGMALALVIVAQQIVTADLVPVSNQRLWIDKFVGWSFYWVVLGLLESVFVGYIYFRRQDKTEKRNRDDASNHVVVGSNEILESHQSLGERLETGTSNWEHLPSVQREHQPHSSTDDEDKTLQNNLSYAETDLTTLKLKLQCQNGTPEVNARPEVTANPSLSQEERVHIPKSRRQRGWIYAIPLRKLDHFFFFLTVTTYTAFNISMGVSIPQWGKNVDSVFLDNATVPSDV